MVKAERLKMTEQKGKRNEEKSVIGFGSGVALPGPLGSYPYPNGQGSGDGGAVALGHAHHPASSKPSLCGDGGRQANYRLFRAPRRGAVSSDQEGIARKGAGLAILAILAPAFAGA